MKRPQCCVSMALALAIGILLPGSNVNLVSGFSSAPLFQPLSIETTCPSTNMNMIQLSAKRQSMATPSLLFSTPKDNKEANNEPNDQSDSSNDTTQQAEVVSDSLTSSQIQSLKSNTGPLRNMKDFFTNKKKFNRESLSKMGMSALLAYGFVSNVSGVIAVSCAWFIFSTRTGISPLANKPAFLGIYAGFTVMLNVIRPARFALSMAISPYFERIRKTFQRKFGVSPKGATVLMVIFINLLGTSALMGLGVGLASILSGVPVWAVK